MITEDFRGQQKDFMKKSKTDNREITLGEVIGVVLYRPYQDRVRYKVDDQERIWFKGDTWVAILDHNGGGFYVKGEFNNYYDVDMITSIRDGYGEIYSVYNRVKDTVELDTWMEVEGDADFLLDREARRLSGERIAWYRRKYYEHNKDRILKEDREYYKKKKEQFS